MIAIAAPLMIFASLQMWLVGVGGAASGSLRGAGDFNAPSGLHLLGSWLIGVPLSYVLAFIATVFGAANVVGGYVVTDRKLQMFKKKPTAPKPDAAKGA